MSEALLDPWSDAATIAARLSSPGARLVMIIGAEAWCHACRTLRPAFESLARQQEAANDVWLWLDLEEHAEFLDDFIPDNLPLLFVYQGDRMTHSVVPEERTAAAMAALLAEHGRTEYLFIPDLRARFLTVDWAS